MEQIQIEFNFNGVNTIIQCKKDTKLKDIYKSFRFKAKLEKKALIFMYNGNTVQNDELTFNEIANSEDKKRNKMNILIVEAEIPLPPQLQNIIRSKSIICPECKEDIKFSIDDYVINLFECRNKHDIDNIFLDKFDSTQNINVSQIKCQICGKYNIVNIFNNIFYRCNTCKKDICPMCCSNHDKEHNIINYDDKNYICDKHNKNYIAYCDDCKENICMFCEQNHKGHSITNYGKLLLDKNKIDNSLKQFEEKKNKLNNDINEIIIKLSKVKENL